MLLTNLTTAAFTFVSLLVILSSLATSHDVAQVLAECRRVTTPDGRLIVWEPRVRNPLNRHIRLVRRSELERVLGPAAEHRSITLWPALARRLGARTDTWYPRLSRVRGLHTHRMLVFER